MSDETKRKRNLLSPKGKMVLFCFVLVAFAIFLIIAFFLFKKTENKEIHKGSFDYHISEICELATLECYYHDVTEETVQPTGLFQYGFFQYGYKKFWIEYDGIAKLGIDASKVKVNGPDNNNTIEIYVPKAQVLDINLISDSMKDPVSETGTFTTITSEDYMRAYAKAQLDIKNYFETNESLLTQSRENAKKILEDFIINSGNTMGAQYNVSWIEEPLVVEQPNSGETSKGE